MKILYVAFAGTEQRGVHRKIAEQVSSMRQHGATVSVLAFAESPLAIEDPAAPYEITVVQGGGFGQVGRARAMTMCREAVARFAPDVVYMRYPIYDAHVLSFTRDVPVVFELQTIFAHEATAEAAAVEAAWAIQVLPYAAGLVGVTQEILDHELARAGLTIPGHRMPNGADPATIPLTVHEPVGDRIDVLCVASFHPWHGIDRLVVGLAAEPDVQDVHVHLVGDGPSLPAIQQLAHEAGIGHRVHCHGAAPVTALDAWYARAHVAIGSLAPHRVGLRELAALKHREYALRALPMVFAGRDADFPTSLAWCRQVDANDSPVSPRLLRALANAWLHPGRRKQIRTWAESHVSWDAKIPPLLQFLTDCARRWSPGSDGELKAPLI